MTSRCVPLWLALVLAFPAQAQTADPLHGFTLEGEPINPVCIGNIQPWLSDTGIIIKSIVLEDCQNSDWAHHDGKVEVEGETVSATTTAHADRGGEHTILLKHSEYKVLGKTDDGVFILMVNTQDGAGNIAAYWIDQQEVQPDLHTPDLKTVHVLTAVSESFFPCFEKAAVKGRDLIIEQSRRDPRTDVCLENTKTTRIKVASP